MARRDQSTEEFCEQYIREMWGEEQSDICESLVKRFHASRHLCESPIEVLMLACLVNTSFGYSDAENTIIPYEDVTERALAEIKGHIIIPQMKIPQFNYRADFFVSLYTNGHKRVGLFVECDGHDYHERTKEQAARDRKRDRDFQSLGFNVLRFTGSEIHRDLDACHAELDLFGCGLIETQWVNDGRDVYGYIYAQRRKSLGAITDV